MPLTFKDAVRKMSGNPKLELFFFFCEKGEDGKPVMLADTRKLDPKKEGPAKKTLDTAQGKGNSIGKMRMSEKTLNLKPQRGGLDAHKLRTGVKMAANHAQAQSLIQGIEVGKEEAEIKDTFDDPLRADPEVAKLLDLRDQKKEEIETTIADDSKKGPEKVKDLQKLQVELKEVEGELLKAQRQLNDKGFKPQPLRPEYQDEDKKYGDWRAKPQRDRFKTDEDYETYKKQWEAATEEQRKKLVESEKMVTKYFTDEERKNSEVHFDEQGRAVGKLVENSDGTVSGPEPGVMLNKKKVEFVMDQSRTLHQFQQKVVKTGTMVDPLTGTITQTHKSTHHSSVESGGPVVGAGEMELDYKGYLTMISNKSGHYKPSATQVIQLLEELARQGALLDKTYVMVDPKDGKVKPLDGKAKQIFEAAAKVEACLKQKFSEGKDPRPDVEAIKKAKEVLAKLGVGPKNKFRDVKVEFLEGAEKLTGAKIRDSDVKDQTTVKKAKEFLETGGGYQKEKEGKTIKQSETKSEVLKELKEKLAKKKVLLDTLAEQRSKALPDKLRKNLEQLPEALKWYQEQLEKAPKDNSDKALEKRKWLMEGIARIEAALKPTDTSDEALGKVLEDLEEYLAKITDDVDRPLEVNDDLARKLGQDLDELKVWAEENGGLTISTVALLMGKNEDEVKKMLRGNQDDDDDDDLDDDDSSLEEPSLKEWLDQGFTITGQELMQKLGINSLGEVTLEKNNLVYPGDLVRKLNLKAEDVYEKLTGKKPK